MRLLRVDDGSIDALAIPPDLLVCASGYESRSTALYKRLAAGPGARSTLVLGFRNTCKPEWRAESDAIFAQHGATVTAVASDDEAGIYDLLTDRVPRLEKLRVVVDYSSMPRSWINAIINFFKLSSFHSQVTMYFSYTLGRHIGRANVPEYPVTDYLISRVESLTTLEGAAVSQNKTLAIVGLGFEWIAPFAACELIEPDDVRVFYAEPGSLPDYGARALELNRRFLAEFSRDEIPFAMPVFSVENAFREIAEIAAPALEFRNVVLVPLGPKPHVLSCILVANRLPEITCVYVRGARTDVQQVEAVEGEPPVISRVIFVREDEEVSDDLVSD